MLHSPFVHGTTQSFRYSCLFRRISVTVLANFKNVLFIFLVALMKYCTAQARPEEGLFKIMR